MGALSVGEQLCMLFVLSEGKCTLSPSSGEWHTFAISAPLCIYACGVIHICHSQKQVIKENFHT